MFNKHLGVNKQQMQKNDVSYFCFSVYRDR